MIWLHAKKIFQDGLKSAQDFSELFVIDPRGKILISTHDQRVNRRHSEHNAIKQALQGQFLHGPYTDTDTLSIGRSSSNFHDEVTLMFYQPVVANDQTIALLCGRVPNDVLGDLINEKQAMFTVNLVTTICLWSNQGLTLALNRELHYRVRALKTAPLAMVKT
ncbi:hypothetical protein P4S73_03575 [Paraglaciecola sp. Hal342]